MKKYRQPHEAFWGIIAQAMGLMIGAFIFWSGSGKPESVLSFLLGFLVCLLPNLVFYVVYFKRQGAQYIHTIKNRFYLGEMLKLFLTAVMFALVWQMNWVEPGWVFLGYGIGLLCFFLPSISIPIMAIIEKNRRDIQET